MGENLNLFNLVGYFKSTLMNHMVFFVSTMILISIIFYKICDFFKLGFSKKHKDGFSILLPAIGVVLFVINYAFQGLTEINKINYSIWYSIGVTALVILSNKIWEVVLNPLYPFLSTEKETHQLFLYKPRDYKKVSELDANKITIYPRITIMDIELLSDWKNPKHIIFDSSDFVVINKSLGTFEGLQESFTVGTMFRFEDKELYAEKVQVDFMNVYDDYTGGILSDEHHTQAHKGKDTPYHIQIIVWARKVVTEK